MGLFSGRTGSTDSESSESSILEGRGILAAGIVIGAVVVCLVVWLVVGSGDPNPPATAPTTSPSVAEPTEEPTEQPTEPPATPGDEPTATVTPPPINNASGGCKAKNPDQRIPRTALPAVSWQFETDMLIPLQAAGGPAVTDSSGVRRCFAHSPSGALLAAMVTLGQVRNPQLTEDVLRTRMAPGAGLTKALAAVRATPPTPSSGRTSQFTGFKFIDYQANRAIISIAVQIEYSNVGSLPITVVWSGGDWKVALQPDGTFNGSVAPDVLRSLDGYVRFGGA